MKHFIHQNRNVFFVIMLFVASCFSPRRSIAIQEGWELLGEEKVDFVRDKDILMVNSNTLFTAIQFKVENKEVRLNELKIYFDNGDKLEPAVDEDIQPGQTSREIELGGEGRHIKQIEFKYRTVGSLVKGRANVLVFGRKYYRPQY